MLIMHRLHEDDALQRVERHNPATLKNSIATACGARRQVAMQDSVMHYRRGGFIAQARTGKAAPRRPSANNPPGGIYPCKPGGPNDKPSPAIGAAVRREQFLDKNGTPSVRSTISSTTDASRFPHRSAEY